MELSAACTTLAQHTEDPKMAAFYYHAAEGYEIKAKNLSVYEAYEILF